MSGYHNPHYPTITEYMERAVVALGHELVIFDDRRHIVPGRIRRRFPWLQRIDLAHINKTLIDLAARSKPDIAVITGGHRISPQSVDTLKRGGMKTVLWTIDAPRTFQPLLRAAPHYDHIFCQGTEALELFNQADIHNARWLPMACDPELHRPTPLSPADRSLYESDIVFVGSHYPERAELFTPLAALPSRSFSIWGPGWEVLPASSPLKNHIKGAHTRPEEWLKIYSAARIVLSSHYRDPLERFPVYQASPRVFEILACGAFQLCDDQRDMFALFQDAHDLVIFTNAEDMVAKVKYYLEHPEERNAIAAQGRKTVLSRHTYQDRIKELLTKIGHDN
ncbi:MAG: glycosyltransferase [Pseudomonadota bacterium]|nr:glycosyltransferase [Pseudomonadota bacterium]